MASFYPRQSEFICGSSSQSDQLPEWMATPSPPAVWDRFHWRGPARRNRRGNGRQLRSRIQLELGFRFCQVGCRVLPLILQDPGVRPIRQLGEFQEISEAEIGRRFPFGSRLVGSIEADGKPRPLLIVRVSPDCGFGQANADFVNRTLCCILCCIHCVEWFPLNARRPEQASGRTIHRRQLGRTDGTPGFHGTFLGRHSLSGYFQPSC